MQKNFRIGQRVVVLQKLIGSVVVEGYGRIEAPENYGKWIVKFDDGRRGAKFIDADAQVNVSSYLARLNAS